MIPWERTWIPPACCGATIWCIVSQLDIVSNFLHEDCLLTTHCDLLGTMSLCHDTTRLSTLLCSKIGRGAPPPPSHRSTSSQFHEIELFRSRKTTRIGRGIDPRCFLIDPDRFWRVVSFERTKILKEVDLWEGGGLLAQFCYTVEY